MKALTIKQPWASLIAYGIKDIENRTWKTNYRGRIYIHASQQPSFASLFAGLNPSQIEEVVKYNLSESGGLMFSNKSKWQYSAIIGEVDIIDCVINHPSIWAEKSKDPINNIYNWVLENPKVYDRPVLNVKGRLSFWNYEGIINPNI